MEESPSPESDRLRITELRTAITQIMERLDGPVEATDGMTHLEKLCDDLAKITKRDGLRFRRESQK